MSDFEARGRAAAAHDARDAAGRPQRRGSKADAIESALMRYLTTEEYAERDRSSEVTQEEGHEGNT